MKRLITIPGQRKEIGHAYPGTNTDSDACSSQMPEYGYFCTRLKHDDGLHVAHVESGEACAMWDDSHAEN